MQSVRFATALVAVAALAACSTTPRDLQGDAGLAASLEVPGPVEAAYRRIVNGARDCLGQHNVMRIDADFFPDVREGVVTVQAVSPGSLQLAFGTLRLSASGASGARIDARYARQNGVHGATWIVRSAREWANGNAAYCSFESGPL